MPESDIYPIGCSIQSIIAMLPLSFKGDKNVVVRIILHNASDANLFHRNVLKAEGSRPPDIGLAIRASVIPGRSIVEVTDDGVGLTEQDFHRYFSNMAEIIARIAPESPGQHPPRTEAEYMDYFAFFILFMSNYAEKITVDSLSRRPGAEPWRLTYWGEAAYCLQPGDRDRVGTSVRFRMKPEYQHLSNPDVLPELLRNYGDFLEFPIIWQGRQINTMSPPWHQLEAKPSDYRAFIRARYPNMPVPLHVIPVRLKRGDVQLRGVFWIPGRRMSILSSDTGTLDLYWRRMLIGRQATGLLPEWARFFTGIIDSYGPRSKVFSLVPEDDEYTFTSTVEDFLIDELARVATEEPEVLAGIAQRHDQLLKLAALENDRVFNAIASYFLFDTTEGRVTLDEYLGISVTSSGQSIIRYQLAPLQSLWSVLRAEKIPVIDASRGLDEAVLQKYDRLNPTVRCVNVEHAQTEQFKEIVDERYAPLIKLHARFDPPVSVRIARFRPASIAAIVAPAADDPMRPELERLFLLSQISGGMSADARSAMQRALARRSSPSQSSAVLLNADSPVIEAMLEALQKGEVAAVEQVARINLMQALMYAGRRVDPHEFRELINATKCTYLNYPHLPTDDGQ